MRPFRLFCSALWALACVTGQVAAQAPEYDLKAAFIYNFVQFTQWPEAALKEGGVTLCAAAGTPLFSALHRVAGKKVQGRPIVLSTLSNALPGGCHAIVSTTEDHGRIAQIQKIAGNGPVLTITDDPDRIREGQIISMVLEGGKIRFSIDYSRANESGLVISSRLLRLAKNVQ